MLVSISGSQGSGKSTLLKRIRELGFKVIDRKTSRSILTDWGVDLELVNNDPDWTLKFQQEIIFRKFQDEITHTSSYAKSSYTHSKDELVFTERTYADLMTYFLIALGKTNRFSKDIDDYYKECIKMQQSYDKVFYLKAGHFTPEHDGVRGANLHYSRMADLTMLDFTTQMTASEKLTVIDTPCLEQRLNIILAHCGVL